jgi:hypothetical protein
LIYAYGMDTLSEKACNVSIKDGIKQTHVDSGIYIEIDESEIGTNIDPGSVTRAADSVYDLTASTVLGDVLTSDLNPLVGIFAIKFDNDNGALNLHGYNSTMKINNQRADTLSRPNAHITTYQIQTLTHILSAISAGLGKRCRPWIWIHYS